jgi:hypothetical protein
VPDDIADELRALEHFYVATDPSPEEFDAIAAELDDMAACAAGSWDRALQYIRRQHPPPTGYGNGLCERVAFVRFLQAIRHRSTRLDELTDMIHALKRAELEKMLAGAHFLMESSLPDRDMEVRDLLFGRGINAEALRRSTGQAFAKLGKRWDRLSGRLISALLKVEEDVELGTHPGRRVYLGSDAIGGGGGGLAARQRRDFSPPIGKLYKGIAGAGDLEAYSSDEGLSDGDGPIEDTLRIHQLVGPSAARRGGWSPRQLGKAGRPRGPKALIQEVLLHREGYLRHSGLDEELIVDGQGQAPGVHAVEVRVPRTAAQVGHGAAQRTCSGSRSHSPSRRSPLDPRVVAEGGALSKAGSPTSPPAMVFEDDDQAQSQTSPEHTGNTEERSTQDHTLQARGRRLIEDSEESKEVQPPRPGTASKVEPASFFQTDAQAEDKTPLAELLRSRPRGADVEEPQAEPAPTNLDVPGLLKQAKAHFTKVDPSLGIEHARKRQPKGAAPPSVEPSARAWMCSRHRRAPRFSTPHGNLLAAGWLLFASRDGDRARFWPSGCARTGCTTRAAAMGARELLQPKAPSVRL